MLGADLFHSDCHESVFILFKISRLIFKTQSRSSVFVSLKTDHKYVGVEESESCF